MSHHPSQNEKWRGGVRGSLRTSPGVAPPPSVQKEEGGPTSGEGRSGDTGKALLFSRSPITRTTLPVGKGVVSSTSGSRTRLPLGLLGRETARAGHPVRGRLLHWTLEPRRGAVGPPIHDECGGIISTLLTPRFDLGPVSVSHVTETGARQVEVWARDFRVG